MTINRRHMLQLTAAGLATTLIADRGRAGETPSALGLWYKQPATVWTEALAIGNGRLGAMVYGGVGREELQLNEDTLWAGGPYDPVHKGAVKNLAEVRRLIFAGQYKDAEALIEQGMMAEPERQMSYQTIGSLFLTSGPSSMASDYRRELDLDRALSRVSFTQDGVRFTRETFASPVDQLIVMRISASQPGRVHLRLDYGTPQAAGVTIDGSDLVLSGTNTSQQGIAAALSFESRARVKTKDGQVIPDGDGLIIAGADEVVILIAAATSFRSWNDVSGDPAALNRAVLANAADKSFADMLAAHVAAHQRLFRRVTLDLGQGGAGQGGAGQGEAGSLPTDQRISRADLAADPGLATLYYQFARYLMISCSRPGTQAAGLQGLWNDQLNAPWGGKYTININTEMNYWPAERGALPECVGPLVDLVRDIAQRGEETAREHYGARGWVCHHNTDIWRATGPIDAATYGTWPMGGAWLCQHLWYHYDHGRDRDFLASVYPIFKGAAQFYLDFLTPEPKHGWLVTCPSMSPEHTHPYGTMICAGPTMDVQILNDLFDVTARSAAILQTGDDAFIAQIRAVQAKMPPMQVGKAGQLQEWLEDWDMQAPDLHHRHVSHLYGLFPSHQINIHDTPELAKAARTSLDIRGDEATGWGTAWRINLWARLAEGDHAFSILKFLLGPERTYPNMFDAHPPFQIDGNFGGANAMMEMLIQAWDDQIMPLPALPKAWPSGSLKGLRLPGNISADLVWAGGRLQALSLTSATDQTVRIRYDNKINPLNLTAGKAVVFSA